MTTSFLPIKGYTVRVGDRRTPISTRYYYVSGLDSYLRSNYIIDAMVPNEKDLVAPTPTASNYRVMYDFGKNFGTMQINGTMFLGCSKQAGDGVGDFNVTSQLKSWYAANQVSVTSKPINMSMASGAAWKVYVVDYSMAPGTNEHNIIPFTIFGYIAPIPA